MKKIYNNLTVENLLKTNIFNKEQKEEIEKGIEEDLDVSIYAKQDFTEYQMREIRLGLEKGLDVSIYAKSEFDYLQMDQIRFCLEKGLNVFPHINPNFKNS